MRLQNSPRTIRIVTYFLTQNERLFVKVLMASQYVCFGVYPMKTREHGTIAEAAWSA